MDPLLPSSEALLGSFLRGHHAISSIVGTRVGTKLAAARPAVRLTRLGSPPSQRWEDSPEIQVECWAEDEVTADLLARTVIAAMPDLLERRDMDGVVKAYDITLGPLNSPDPFTDQPRYLVGVRLLIYSS